MAGYSYFDYDQMTLLGIEVHSDELELLQQAADTYDWKAIETEVEPEFKEAALDFRDREHSFACPRRDELDEDLQETFPFLDDMAETEVVDSDRNPIGIGFLHLSPSFPNRAYLSRQRMERLRQFQSASLTLLVNSYMAHYNNSADTRPSLIAVEWI